MSEIVVAFSLLVSVTSIGFALTARYRARGLADQVMELTDQLKAFEAQIQNKPGAKSPETIQQIKSLRHDLRTPLMSILGFCSLIKQTSVDMAPKQEAFLSNIDESAHQMLRLIQAAGREGVESR